VTRINADIDALKEFHAALVRFRYAQRDAIDRSGDKIEVARASLAEKADRWHFVLERCQAELDDCQHRAARAATGDSLADCSGYAASVAEAAQRLEQIRRWRQRVDEEASTFHSAMSRFRTVLDNDLPRTEAHLLAIIASLEAARGVQAASS
jgi:phage shock protein A